jgi:DNA-binding MurR/RpiR family transcriptional regulator
MGRKGFSDFKIALARDLAQAGFSAARRPLTGKNDASLFESVFTFHAQCLNETLQINTEEAIVRASRMLETARRIEFFSIGMSYPVAYTACAKLRLIGFPVSVECDAHLQLINATQLRKGDVAFAISCSGRTRETVKCLAIARENEASTLCLTNCLESPITAYADVCLYATPSEIKYFQAPLASRVTQLALIDALFVGIALRRKGKTMRILKSAGEKLLEHRIQ